MQQARFAQKVVCFDPESSRSLDQTLALTLNLFLEVIHARVVGPLDAAAPQVVEQGQRSVAFLLTIITLSAT